MSISNNTVEVKTEAQFNNAFMDYLSSTHKVEFIDLCKDNKRLSDEDLRYYRSIVEDRGYKTLVAIRFPELDCFITTDPDTKLVGYLTSQGFNC